MAWGQLDGTGNSYFLQAPTLPPTTLAPKCQALRREFASSVLRAAPPSRLRFALGHRPGLALGLAFGPRPGVLFVLA